MGTNYEFIRTVAAGGMGSVQEVRDRRTGMRYAAKVVLKADDPTARERFRREAELLARCDRHAGIVKVHALVADERGAQTLIMDFVEGESLDDLLERERRLEPRRAAEIALGVAEALAFAHARGIVHRDVKPANVLIDADGKPRLTDFGLATARDVERLTRTGQFMGTVLWCAPEQVSRVHGEVVASADVFSLGTVLFQMLAGEPPVNGESIVSLLANLRSASPIPDVRSLAPETPADLASIVTRCLEKDPGRRYPSGAEVARDLCLHLDGARKGRRDPRWKQRPLLVAVVVLAALGALAPLVVSRARSPSDTPPSPLAPSVVTRPPAPSAPPARVAPPSLGWKWSGPVRVSIATSMTGDSPGMSAESFQKLVMAWTPVKVSTTNVTVSSRIEGLEYRMRVETDRQIPAAFTEMLRPIAFDSEKPDDAASPFHEAVGRTFDFDMDPRTGAIAAVRSAAEIQRAIVARVEDAKMRSRFVVSALASDGAMAGLLEALLHLVGEEGEIAGGRWTIVRHDTRPTGTRPRRDDPVSFDIAARVISREERGGASFEWSGEGAVSSAERRIVGRATFARGHIARSEQEADYTTSTGHMRVVETLEDLPAK